MTPNNFASRSQLTVPRVKKKKRRRIVIQDEMREDNMESLNYVNEVKMQHQNEILNTRM